MHVKLIIALVFALAVALFAIQNAQTIDIQFLTFTLSGWPVAGVIIGMLVMGVFLGFIFSLPGSLSNILKMRRLESEIIKKREELTSVTEELQKLREEASVLQAELQQCKESRIEVGEGETVDN